MLQIKLRTMIWGEDRSSAESGYAAGSSWGSAGLVWFVHLATKIMGGGNFILASYCCPEKIGVLEWSRKNAIDWNARHLFWNDARKPQKKQKLRRFD